MTSADPATKLPPEIFVNILNFLSSKDFVNTLTVSWMWYKYVFHLSDYLRTPSFCKGASSVHFRMFERLYSDAFPHSSKTLKSFEFQAINSSVLTTAMNRGFSAESVRFVDLPLDPMSKRLPQRLHVNDGGFSFFSRLKSFQLTLGLVTDGTVLGHFLFLMSPTLERLEITFNKCYMLDEPWSEVELPRLKTLELVGTRGIRDFPNDYGCRNFLQQFTESFTFPILERLEMSYCGVEETTLRTLIVPTLKRAKLVLVSVDDAGIMDVLSQECLAKDVHLDELTVETACEVREVLKGSVVAEIKSLAISASRSTGKVRSLGWRDWTLETPGGIGFWFTGKRHSQEGRRHAFSEDVFSRYYCLSEMECIQYSRQIIGI